MSSIIVLSVCVSHSVPADWGDVSLCVSLMFFLFASRPFAYSDKNHTARVRGRSRPRPGSLCISSKQSGGAPVRQRERAGTACFMNESPFHRTAGRTPSSACTLMPVWVRRAAGSSRAAGRRWARTVDTSSHIGTTWSFHHTRSNTTGEGTGSTGYGGRAEAHDTRQLCGHYDPVCIHRWTLGCACVRRGASGCLRWRWVHSVVHTGRKKKIEKPPRTHDWLYIPPCRMDCWSHVWPIDLPISCRVNITKAAGTVDVSRPGKHWRLMGIKSRIDQTVVVPKRQGEGGGGGGGGVNKSRNAQTGVAWHVGQTECALPALLWLRCDDPPREPQAGPLWRRTSHPFYHPHAGWQWGVPVLCLCLRSDSPDCCSPLWPGDGASLCTVCFYGETPK